MLAQQILRKGRLSFDADPGGIYAPAPDGRFYASHDIGNTLAMLPSIALGNWLESRFGDGAGEDAERIARFLVSFNPSVFVSLVGLGFFLALRWGFGADLRIASSGALLLVFCTTLWPYSRNLFEGVFASVWITWALAMAVTARATRAPAATVLAGACLGAALITRTTSGLCLPALLAYLAWVGWDRRPAWRNAITPVVLALLAFAPFLAWQLSYNALRTGVPWLTPLALPKYAAGNALDGNTLVGLAGFLVSPGKSIFLYSPVLVLSVVGAPRFRRARPAEFWLVTTVVAAFLLVHATLRSWAGEWGWGPRYLVTITPWMLLPAISTLEAARSDHAQARWRLLVRVAIAVGLVVQLSALINNWHYRYAYLVATHRLGPQTIWTVSGSQLTDAVTAAWKNLNRIAGRDVPFDIVPTADSVNIRASNTLNVWWLTAINAGVPRRVLVPLVLALAVLSARLWIGHARATRATS